jgi:hypothetical protein
MPPKINLEILSLLPITYKQCTHCERFYDLAEVGDKVHEQILREYPRNMLEDSQRLTTLVLELSDRYKDDISIQIIDPHSIPGMIRTLRFRLHKYPAFILNNQKVIVGWDRSALDQALEACSWIS